MAISGTSLELPQMTKSGLCSKRKRRKREEEKKGRENISIKGRQKHQKKKKKNQPSQQIWMWESSPLTTQLHTFARFASCDLKRSKRGMKTERKNEEKDIIRESKTKK